MQLRKYITVIIVLVLVNGCSSGGDDPANTSDNNVQAYTVDCSASAAYVPVNDPVGPDNPVVEPVKATIIFMHWKIGSPQAPELKDMYNSLAAAGYDVIAPYMPWNSLAWTGDMCGAVNYIQGLAAQEAVKGNNVIIAGHGMGATHALIFGVAAAGSGVKGIVAIAPGHFPQLFIDRQAEIAPDIARAESMEASGNGDVIDTFNTYDVNAPILISATASNYLSYHSLDRFPSILDVLSATSLPVLWLAGDLDPITSIFQTDLLFNRIPSQGSDYQVITGADHSNIVADADTPIAISAWLGTLGL